MKSTVHCLQVSGLLAGLVFESSLAAAQDTKPGKSPAELGTDAYEHGYFSQCLTLWPRAWQTGKDSPDENVRARADRAFVEWMKMLSRLGRVAELRAGLESVEGRHGVPARPSLLGSVVLRTRRARGRLPSATTSRLYRERSATCGCGSPDCSLDSSAGLAREAVARPSRP